MRTIINKVQKFVKEEDAASAVEYGLLLAFITLAIFTALSGLGNKLNSNFTTIAKSLSSGGSHPPPASPFM